MFKTLLLTFHSYPSYLMFSYVKLPLFDLAYSLPFPLEPLHNNHGYFKSPFCFSHHLCYLRLILELFCLQRVLSSSLGCASLSWVESHTCDVGQSMPRGILLSCLQKREPFLLWGLQCGVCASVPAAGPRRGPCTGAARLLCCYLVHGRS